MRRVENANEYRYWKTVRAIGIALLFFLLFLNLFSISLELLNRLFQFLDVGQVAGTVMLQLYYAAGYLASFMLPVAFLRLFLRKAGYSYRPMRAQASLSPWFPLILFAGIAVIWALSYVNAMMVSIFNYSAFSSDVLWQEGGDSAWYRQVLTFLTLCLVPAFCEEYLFRGAILTNCLPFGRGTAILISSLLFALMHQNAEQLLYAFAAGLVLGLVYERTGSIWNCVLLHLFNNFLGTFQNLFLQGVSDRYSNVLYALLEGILFSAGLIAAVVLIFRFAPRKADARDGIFGKSLPASDSWAESPVRAGRAVRLFLNLPMVVFLAMTVLTVVLLIVRAVQYHG